jgi:hypothetical protein
MPKAERILYCHCAFTGLVPLEKKLEVLKRLVDSGAAFDATADLCELAARKDPALARLAGRESVAVIACRERAVRALFDAAGAALPERSKVLDMRSADPAALAEAVREATGGENPR